MNETTPSEWAHSVAREVATVCGPEQAAGDAAAWDQFARSHKAVVTVYGPYNAGKSTLIRRLLAEAKAEEPDWLTISGRPETFRAGQAPSGNLVLVDTPGLAAGREEHRKAAEAALAYTDALVITWPAVLATGEQTHLAEVIGGRHYGPAAAGYFPPGALIVIIGKADTAVMDATADLDGYAAMCAAKRAELEAILRRILPPGSVLPPVLTVSADPLGAVGQQRQAPASAYAESKGWDGIEELRNLLEALPARLPALRTAALIRYWSLRGTAVIATAEEKEAELEKRVAEEATAQEWRQNLTGDLTALSAAAEQDLIAQVAMDLGAVIDGGFASVVDAREAVGRRLDATRDAWALHWYGQLDRVLRGAGAQHPESGDAPPPGTAMRPGDHWYGQDPVTAEAQRRNQELRTLFHDIKPHADQIGQSFVEIFAGIDETFRPGLTRTYGEVTQMAAAATEIVLLIANDQETRRLMGLQLERRERMRGDIGKVSQEMADGILDGNPEAGKPGLRTAINDIIRQQHAAGHDGQAAAASAKESAARLSAAREALGSLLDNPPATG
jgi:predicted GTPase